MGSSKWDREHPEKMREYRRKWAARNPEKMRAARKAWRLSNPDKVDNLHRAYIYGLAPGQYELMLEAQGHRCAICRSATPKGKTWHIDHDHLSGVVRGILCRACNTALGALGDDVTGLCTALAYLRRAEGQLDETVDEHF